MSIIVILPTAILRFTRKDNTYISRQWLDQDWVEVDEPAVQQLLSEMEISGLLHDSLVPDVSPVIYELGKPKVVSHRMTSGHVAVTAQEVTPIPWQDLFMDATLELATQLAVPRATITDYLDGEDEVKSGILTVIEGDIKQMVLVKQAPDEPPFILRVQDGTIAQEPWDMTTVQHQTVQHILLDQMETSGVHQIMATVSGNTLVICEPYPAKGEQSKDASGFHITVSTVISLDDQTWEEYTLKLLNDATVSGDTP